MGRSLAPVAAASAAGEAAVFRVGPSEYAIENRDGRPVHRESLRDEKGHVVAHVEAEIAYDLGSGTRGISYLFEREGRLFQSPIAWYGQERKWGLAPGYERRNFHFDRAIEPQCLFCHANRAEPVELSVNRYREPTFRGHAIGCERCHGPGELHVRGQELVDGQDVSIVNPRHLEASLRDAVCQQCHLLGDYRIERPGREPFDYRPGLTLTAFMTVLERASRSGNKAVRHFEQMRESGCFRGSEGRLGCTSCHDPHSVPAAEQEAAYYRKRCLACHEQRLCDLPAAERLARNREDSCVACHMPVSANTDVAHNATTDHRIPRLPESPPATPPGAATGPPLVVFHADQLGPSELRLADRELGIGLTLEARRPGEGTRRTRLARAAIDLLDQALARRPDDLAALRYRAQATALAGRPAEGLRLYDALLAEAPGYEKALDERVSLALEVEDRRDALAPARQAVAVNPWSAVFHERLAFYRLQERSWSEALREAEQALRLDPFLADARRFLIQCHLHLNHRERAGEELEALIALDPTQDTPLRLWFARQLGTPGRG
jgi:predicted CXXCH cytochrome family protein